MEKVWFITGSSRGLGRSITKAVLENGDKVVATARNTGLLQDLEEQYSSQILILSLDVSLKSQIHSTVEKAIAHFGRIDVLVNNAGFGITGSTEAFTEEQVRSQLNVNLLAPIEITQTILPYMRKQRSGKIFQISSIGGRVGNAGLSIYQAAKFGLSGFSESLRKEVEHLGIQVTSVEPGGFRTDWAGTSMTYAPFVEGYEESIEQMKDFLSSGKFIPIGDPEKAAKVFIDLVNHPQPPMHLVLGSEAASILKKANEVRNEEFEQWLPVTLYTDHEDAAKFYETAEGKNYLIQKGIKL
ncbi:SDR family NAD(P)-dependent oxidoreductase [Flavobacterium seoulense]|uniref:Oxidoreductase n=1 Tax=Flavobacterium seoulense TaxID=1492738 RepID=A0A066WX67_9FLAO|nr:SDR family NAD(P)-dependent oxidoreductase [Flavobacterium seoulense]KDN55245.1 oxidoreductase [Flavobacterium seoulense]